MRRAVCLPRRKRWSRHLDPPGPRCPRTSPITVFLETGSKIGRSNRLKQFQLSIDPQVIRFLFREIDPWIEDDRFTSNPRSDRLADLLVKKALQGAKNVSILDISMALFRQADRMHDQEPGSILCRDPRVLVGRKRTQYR